MRHERVRCGHVEAQLAKAIVASARGSGVAIAVEEHRSRPWASATFVGAQHGLILVADDAAGLGDWLATLPDAELALRGNVVASLAVDAVDGTRATLAVLTLQDG